MTTTPLATTPELALTPDEYGRRFAAIRERLRVFSGVIHPDILYTLNYRMADHFARTPGLDPDWPFRTWPTTRLRRTQRERWEWVLSVLEAK